MERRQSSNSSSYSGGNSTIQSTRRRQTDFMKIATSGKYTVTPTENVGEFFVLFPGPAETPYEGGWWSIRVTLTDQYPYRSPSIGFTNRIFHPNVDEYSGSVCLDVINQTWTPMYDLINVFDIFLPQLLRYPNPADPLNPEAAALSMSSQTNYNSKVQAHVALHASKSNALQVMQRLISSSSTEEEDEQALEEKQSDAIAKQRQQGKDNDSSMLDISPATTFASRGLTESPPSSLDEGGLGEEGAVECDEDEDEPAEIEL